MYQDKIILEGHRLAVIRSERIIFRNINFTIQNGHNLLLIGKNGSGKSTLLKLLAGTITSSEGQLLVNGNPSTIKPYLHYISDSEQFKPELTPYQNLIHFSYLLNPLQNQKYHELNCLNSITKMNLYPWKDYPTKYLSFGQRKRLSLARLLLKEYKIWLLDEPTVGLDKKSLQLLSTIIEKHNCRGGITIISSHNNLILENVSILELE